MKVAVLGSGNGGHAVAFEWAKAGHAVYLFDFEAFPKGISAVHQAGGITSIGELEGFQPVAYAGHDLSQVLPGAELIFVVGPAYSTDLFGKACKPYVCPGQIYVICPGSCAGSIAFKNALGLALGDERVVVAETSTLPYAVRVVGEAKIEVYNRLKGDYFIAALPAKCNNMVYDVVGQVYPEMRIASNVLQTTLQNANPIIHPTVCLLNAALIERTQGSFLFYEEGVTPAVGRLIEALDKERIAIGEKLGIPVTPDPELSIQQGYMTEASYETGYTTAPGFRGIKAQPRLDCRYFDEDAGYGLVFFSDLGHMVGVPTPATDAVVLLVSTLMKRDYTAEAARTMASLGLAHCDLEQLKSMLS